jgi:hypothetical protein
MLVSADGPGKLGSVVVKRILKGEFVKEIWGKYLVNSAGHLDIKRHKN